MRFIVWCKDNFQYYVVFSKSILFISGLIFSYKLVDKVFFNILITYLTSAWKHYDLRKAAIIVNLQEGICVVLQIFFAFIADAYLGLFRMVVGSTTLYIIGLWLIRFAAGSAGSLDLKVFYPGLVLMTLSQAALIITLPSFLDDQVVARDRPATQEKEERAQERSKFWLYFLSFLAAIFALFGALKNVSFRDLSLILAIAMGAAFLWFLLGIKIYGRLEPTGSALSDVVFVIHSAIIKRNVAYPQTSEQLYQNSSALVQILPHVPWLRWLDRAAVVQESPAGKICTVEQVKGVKFLLKMLPMWTTFLTFSLVAALGSTFFLEEAYSLISFLEEDNSLPKVILPIVLLTNLQRLTEFIVARISDYVIEKLGINAQRMTLVRIGIGMVCCVLCCLAGWANAVHRLRLVNNDKDPKDSMSVYRLTPQYVLLGFMEGLSADGLQNFFHFQVSRSLSKYGPPFGECVMGVGKFLSIVFILIFSKWLKSSEDGLSDRLDKYYVMLAILSSVNIILYCLVAYWYGDDTFLSGDASPSDPELGISGPADPQVDSVASFVSRSLSNKGQNIYRQSLSCRISPISEESSSGDHLTENTNGERSQTHQEKDKEVPEQGQEITLSSSSTVLQADKRRGAHEAETLKPDDLDSTDRDSLLASQSNKNSASDALLRRAATAFLRLSSRGIRKRSHSMRLEDK